jgi:anti-sigma regulatory factor (Ser/Thr protein kinase)
MDQARGTISRSADVVHGAKPSPEPVSDIGPAVPRDSSVTTHWALMDTLTLAALPTAVGSARLHARIMMVEWALVDIADDVALVVSELVTNAVVASTGMDGRPVYASADAGLPVVHLRLCSDHSRIVIEVWDSSADAPEAKQPAPDAENGRGLLLVEALSERWGWDRIPGWPGKVVWAILSVE